MNKLLFVLLILFSSNIYALTEAECLDRATFISVIGYEYRDKSIPLEKTKGVVLEALVGGGIPLDIVQKQAIPLVEWLYSTNKKVEVLASDWFEACLKGSTDGNRLPRKNEGRWEDRTNLQWRGNPLTKETG
jgi:hypothetical protein